MQFAEFIINAILYTFVVCLFVYVICWVAVGCIMASAWFKVEMQKIKAKEYWRV